LPSALQEKIKANWKAYWPQTGTPPNWDAVLYSKREDEWIIVGAKARLQELESSCGASDGSRKIIESALGKTQERFGIQCGNCWLFPYYQLANRLAFINFLLENKIKASLLYIYFLNGWPNNPNKNVTSQKAWRGAIDTEYSISVSMIKPKNIFLKSLLSAKRNAHGVCSCGSRRAHSVARCFAADWRSIWTRRAQGSAHIGRLEHREGFYDSEVCLYSCR
jgi:hypothetical protein